MATRTKIKADKVARIIIFSAGAVILVGLLAVIIVLGIRMVRGFAGGGGEKVRVPDVIGLTEQDARQRVESAGFKVNFVEPDYNDQHQAGIVFYQKPEGNLPVRPGRTVLLRLSKGPANLVVPDLVGKPIDSVITILASSGFRLGRITKIYSTDVTPGSVINQDPEPGRKFTSEIGVNIVVADNQNLPVLTMPDLIGTSLNTVEDELQRANLRLASITYVANDEQPRNTVVSQNIAAGEDVEMGSGIELEVAIPSELKHAQTKTFNIRFTVPRGPDEQQVRIKVFDDLGAQVAYDTTHAPGYIVDRTLTVQGKATIMLFINDTAEPYRREKI